MADYDNKEFDTFEYEWKIYNYDKLSKDDIFKIIFEKILHLKFANIYNEELAKKYITKFIKTCDTSINYIDTNTDNIHIYGFLLASFYTKNIELMKILLNNDANPFIPIYKNSKTTLKQMIKEKYINSWHDDILYQMVDMLEKAELAWKQKIYIILRRLNENPYV